MFRDLYYKQTTIDDGEGKQDEFSAVSVLEGYALRDNKYVEAKNKLLNNAKKFYIGREKIIEGFKNDFHFIIMKRLSMKWKLKEK